MASAFVQERHTTSFPGSAASVSLAYTSNNTAGNLLFVWVYWFAATGSATFSDSQGNIYIPFTLQHLQSGSVQAAYVKSCKGGANTVTATFSPNENGVIAISEYSGVNTADQFAWTSALSGSAMASGNVTTNFNGEVIIGFGNNSTTSTIWTPGTGFTKRNGNSAPIQLEDQVNQNAGTFNATWTVNQTTAWGAGIATFYQATNTDSFLLLDIGT